MVRSRANSSGSRSASGQPGGVAGQRLRRRRRHRRPAPGRPARTPRSRRTGWRGRSPTASWPGAPGRGGSSSVAPGRAPASRRRCGASEIATAFAQLGSGWPPPDSAGGIRFQHSASLSSATGPSPAPGDAAAATAGSSTAPSSNRTHSSLISKHEQLPQVSCVDVLASFGADDRRGSIGPRRSGSSAPHGSSEGPDRSAVRAARGSRSATAGR